jgi:hypothetical protein
MIDRLLFFLYKKLLKTYAYWVRNVRYTSQ